MIKNIILVGGLVIAGCAQRGVSPVGQSSSPYREIILSRLSYHDGILEGQLLNNSEQTVKVVVIEISFLDPAGTTMFSQEFRAVPGGDGQAILPSQAKHFNYKVSINAQAGEIAVSGKIKSVTY